jgi:hypothetical protein
MGDQILGVIGILEAELAAAIEAETYYPSGMYLALYQQGMLNSQNIKAAIGIAKGEG